MNDPLNPEQAQRLSDMIRRDRAQTVTITAPSWVFDALVVAGQCEAYRRKDDHPSDPDWKRFADAWSFVQKALNP